MADIKIANAEYHEVTQIELESLDGDDILFNEGGFVGATKVVTSTASTEGTLSITFDVDTEHLLFFDVSVSEDGTIDGSVLSLHHKIGEDTMVVQSSDGTNSLMLFKSGYQFDINTSDLGLTIGINMDVGIGFYGNYTATLMYSYPTDLSSDTVTADKMLEGTIAHDANGDEIVGTLTVTSGSGDDVINAIIDKSITEIESFVTSIGRYVFYYCSKLTSANFPSAISIDLGAFGYCSELTEVSSPLVTKIDDSAFTYCSKLTSANFPVATYIGTRSFYYCTSITSANFPIATYIGSYGFAYCSNLSSANFPSVKTVSTYAFEYCYKLTSADFPVATSIGTSAFYQCSTLTSANFPVATSIGTNGFYYCSKLTSANFPLAKSIGSNGFYYCSKLTSANFPLATSIGSSAFARCEILKTVNLSSATSIGSNAFAICSKLTDLYLLSPTVCTYSTTSSSQDPTDSNLKIHVPAELLESYKTATNWSRLASKFVAYNGELD